MPLADPNEDLLLLAPDAPPVYGVYDAASVVDLDVDIGIWLVEGDDATEFEGRSFTGRGRRLIYGPDRTILKNAMGDTVARLEKPWRPIGFYCFSGLALVAPYVAPHQVSLPPPPIPPDSEAFGQALPLCHS